MDPRAGLDGQKISSPPGCVCVCIYNPPVSSTLAKIYLQFFEEFIIKHLIQSEEIFYYKMYVDDTLIIFHQGAFVL